MRRILPGLDESLLLTCGCTVAISSMFHDEVVDAWYCVHLAGPLAWDGDHADAYSLALLWSGGRLRVA